MLLKLIIDKDVDAILEMPQEQFKRLANEKLMHEAIHQHLPPVVERFIAIGLTQNLDDHLFYAVKTDSNIMARLLLEAGANIMFKDDFKKTVFQYAKSIEMYRMLVSHLLKETIWVTPSN